MLVLRIACDVKTSQISFCYVPSSGQIISHNPKFLEKIAADIHPLVTAGTALIFKDAIAFFFFIAESSQIAAQEFVKTGIGSVER